MSFSVEINKTIPIVAEVDVLVVGGGIAGCTAAIAAARNGAKTMLVEKFGYLGGNMGPAIFGGATTFEVPDIVLEKHPPGGNRKLPGIAGEFIARCESHSNAALLSHYMRDSQVVSHVWFQMMKEEDVTLTLNSFASDPIMKGNEIQGLTVENKSGTQAIRSRVVVDATGDADVAFRAGVPIESGKSMFIAGLYFAVGNVEYDLYKKAVLDVSPTEQDLQWGREKDELVDERAGKGTFELLLPFYRKSWEAGDFEFIRRVPEYGNARIVVDHGIFAGVSNKRNPISHDRYQIIGGMAGIFGVDRGITSGNARAMTDLEVATRMYIFDTAVFLRKWVPGFAKSYLHMVSPYFHARGGRSMMAEYSLSMDDVKNNRRHDDMVFQGSFQHIEGNFDFPYRQLLPQEVENLLAAGRSAVIQPPEFRVRWMVFMMGEVAGAAAALSVREKVAPKHIDIEKLRTIIYR